MTYDLAAAKAQLASLAGGSYTQQDLLDLARQVDISARGTVTVLYSGTIDGVKTSSIADGMRSDSSIRIINKTAAAEFLSSREFLSGKRGHVSRETGSQRKTQRKTGSRRGKRRGKRGQVLQNNISHLS